MLSEVYPGTVAGIVHLKVPGALALCATPDPEDLTANPEDNRLCPACRAILSDAEFVEEVESYRALVRSLMGVRS